MFPLHFSTFLLNLPLQRKRYNVTIQLGSLKPSNKGFEYHSPPNQNREKYGEFRRGGKSCLRKRLMLFLTYWNIIPLSRIFFQKGNNLFSSPPVLIYFSKLDTIIIYQIIIFYLILRHLPYFLSLQYALTLSVMSA